MRLRQLPIFGSAAGVSVDLLLTGGDFLAWLFINVTELVPAVAMASSYVAPSVEWIPSAAVDSALLLVALLAIGVTVGQVINSYISENQE